ncbi:MAG: hypothetical protein IH626_17900 [Rhodospirillales bacterium]|nr:hypothetical protein [Rhodospirillales bacterium]
MVLRGDRALVLGGLLLRHALRVWRDETNRSTMPLFGYSRVYLFLIFVFLLADSLLIPSV